MKKKYIAIVALLCVILALLILGISNLKKKENNDKYNKNDGNSVTVDDLKEEEKDTIEGEFDSWNEPSTDETIKQESLIGTKDDTTLKDEKKPEDSASNESEENNKEEEKPEWIGGDF